MSSRFIDWLTSLTAKSTTIDGTEITHIGSSGLSQKATLANVIQYGGGATRNETAGNATVTRNTSGALWLEVAGQTAGNARGAGAFDWQATRNAATQVAAAPNSITVGDKNTVAAAANSAGAFGYLSNATANYAFAFGNQCAAAGQASFAVGQGANPTLIGQFAVSSGGGIWQSSIISIGYSTTDTVPAAIPQSNNINNRLIIPANRTWVFTGLIVAQCNVSNSSNFIKAWKIEGCISRDNNGTTKMIGTPTVIVVGQDADGTPTPSTWNVIVSADDVNDALAIVAYGQAGTTIKWSGTLLTNSVGF